MKKILLLLVVTLVFGNTSFLKGQCYGTVLFDNAVNANGATTVTITTANPNELIMIAYDGWPQPGAGPVTVDGNPATHVLTAFDNNNSGVAETYAYGAATAGTHTIVCTETNYSYPPYGLNLAAAFYSTSGNITLAIPCFPDTNHIITCTTGGTVTTSITSHIPGSMIYCNFENNNGQTGPFTDSWTGATFLNQLHEGNGIDASEAYEPAPTVGTYAVTVSNNANPNNGCGGLVLALTIIQAPILCGGLTVVPTVTNPICGNCNGNISLVVSGGTPGYTYTWSPNVSTSANATGLCGGTYSVTVQDASCPPKDTTLVFVLPSNSLGLTDTLTVNENCNGDCNGSSEVVTHGGVSPYVYSWAPSGGNAPTANNLCAGNYTVTVNDNGGCSNTILVAITAPAVLTVSTTVNNVLCFGGTGTATATAVGGTSPYRYGWSNAETTGTATGLSAGTYTVGVIDSRGCTASSTATLTQPSQLDVSLSGPAIVCRGNQGTLTANPSGGTSPYQYTWMGINVNPSNTYTSTINAATQTDTVKVTDANGCTASAQITVNLGPNMTVSIVGPSSICNGLSTTLCADIQGGTGGNTYSWQSPVNAITPCVNVSPTTTTTYSLNVFDNCGTEASATFNLRVNPLPTVAFTSSLFEGCAPLCVQFYNTTTLAQGKAATYLWTFGDGDSSNIASPIHCYPNNGNYDVGVTVTSDSGCSSTLKKTSMITALSRPNGAFIYSPQSINIINPTVQFTNISTDAYNIIYWKWNFGDKNDSVSNAENPSYTYQDTGSYCVSMVAMDVHGCTDTVTDCLIVEPAFNLYIPSAFTPNGDAKNPTFTPKGDYIKSFEMYIFDRWGMQIYHTTDITQGWDGTVNGGSVAQEDTYIYKIIVTDSEKKQHTYVGNVTLLK